jgi:hypothetical protein
MNYPEHQKHLSALRELARTFNLIALSLALFWGLVAGAVVMFASPVISSGQSLVIPVAIVVFVVVFMVGRWFLWLNYSGGDR